MAVYYRVNSVFAHMHARTRARALALAHALTLWLCGDASMRPDVAMALFCATARAVSSDSPLSDKTLSAASAASSARPNRHST
eukprot:363611-Chlamydomonas_euryale.AAC.24